MKKLTDINPFVLGGFFATTLLAASVFFGFWGLVASCAGWLGLIYLAKKYDRL